MISKRELVTVLVAAAAGFAGGLASTRPHDAQAADTALIRARRFELVDDSGKTIAYWGFDDRYRGRLVIAFKGAKAASWLGLALPNSIAS
jgi:hypothetical protein